MADVGAPALDQMPRQLAPNARAFCLVEVRWKVREVVVEQAQERSEGLLVAAVRRGGDEDEVPRLVRRDSSDKLEALLPSASDAAGQACIHGPRPRSRTRGT